MADLDHRTPYDGSNTTSGNLHALCRRHHRLKTLHRGWTVTHVSGTTTSTSPTGHAYTRLPDPLWASDPPRPAQVPDSHDSPVEDALHRLLVAA